MIIKRKHIQHRICIEFNNVRFKSEITGNGLSHLTLFNFHLADFFLIQHWNLLLE